MKHIVLVNFLYVPMCIVWILILYFIIKSNFWKKFFLYLGVFLFFASSIPAISTIIGKFFYSDNYKVSKSNKNPSFILIPTAGHYHDGYGKWHPTYESIMRIQYGKNLSDQFSIPMILSGGTDAILLQEMFGYDYYLVESEIKNTFQMAENLKDFINPSEGSLLLATKPVHHKRTILVLEKQGFNVLIPDNYVRTLSGINYSFVPSIEGFKAFNEIIYEFFALIWYFISGKI